jgi:glycosyltransferase involved in cell wall biosynthesis
LLSPDPRVTGGVTVFADLLTRNLTDCRVTAFQVGSLEDGREGALAMARRLLVAPVQLVRLVRRGDFDVVHINPSLTAKAVIRDGLLLLALRGIGYRRVLFYIHGWRESTAVGLRRTPGLRRLTAWLLNGTAHIMVLAPQFKEALVAMGVEAGKITFTRTMFDGRALELAGAESPPQGRRRVLYMSRFVREKGIFELVEAFARIAGEFPDVDLVLAGDGPDRAELEVRVRALGLAGRATFPGYVRGAEKMRVLRSCTLFTLPTYDAEGMPIALLEAMGAGKPLLTAKAAAIPHIIFDPENGVVLNAVTADTVEAGLRRLLGDPAYCEEVGKRNAAYGWERFEAKPVTAEIEALYRKIATLEPRTLKASGMLSRAP